MSAAAIALTFYCSQAPVLSSSSSPSPSSGFWQLS